jgi:hypothetical protein
MIHLIKIWYLKLQWVQDLESVFIQISFYYVLITWAKDIFQNFRFTFLQADNVTHNQIPLKGNVSPDQIARKLLV